VRHSRRLFLGGINVTVVGVIITIAGNTVAHQPGEQVGVASMRSLDAFSDKTFSSRYSLRDSPGSSAVKSCAETLFVGARGSGEYGPGTKNWPAGRSSSDYYGLGAEVNQVYTRLSSDVGTRQSIQVNSVNYGSDHVQTLAHDIPKYFRDLSAGVNWTLADLQENAEKCSDQQIVLAGYSQGAMVMHRVLHDLSGTAAGKRILSRITAAILIGDGDQVPFDNEIRFGSALSLAMGVGQAFPTSSGSSIEKFSGDQGPQVLRVCNLGDIVCDYWGIFSIPAGITTHLGYTGSKPLRQATDRAAADVLTLHYTGGTVKINGSVGVPVFESAFVTGGIEPLNVFGGIDGNAPPPWFSESIAGRVVSLGGTPTSAGSWTIDMAIEDAKGEEVTIPVKIKVLKAAGDWTAMKAPLPVDAASGSDSDLRGVDCPSPSQCLAVGNYASGQNSGLVLTGLGSSWSATGASVTDWTGTPLNGLACPSVSDCIALGPGNDLLLKSGSSWTTQQVPLPVNGDSGDLVTLDSVACQSISTCVVIGDYFDTSGYGQGFLVSGSGSSWTASEMPVPTGGSFGEGSPGRISSADFLACTSASCAVVGNYTDSSGSQQGMVVSGSGSSWTATKMPQPSVGTFEGYSGIACASVSACVVSGNYTDSSGNLQGMVVSGSGSSWTATKMPLPTYPNIGDPALTGQVACPSTSKCVTVVIDMTPSGYEETVLTGLGTSWHATEVAMPSSVDSLSGWGGLACASSSACAAVAGDGTTELVLRSSGTSWALSEVPVPDGGQQFGSYFMACASAADCVAVSGYVDSSSNIHGLLLTGPG
jgi:hypothetical protein